jgi:CRP/FNR family transcriptional regulator
MLDQRRTAYGFSNFTFTGTLELLNGMNQQIMQRINSRMRITKRQRGEWVFVLGDPANSIYFLQKGRVKLTALSAEGQEVLHEIINPGEIFGDTSAMLGVPRTTSAQALELSLLYEISRKDFEALLVLNPELSLQLLKSVGRRLKKAEAQLVNVICKDVSQRVKDALIDLMDRESSVGSNKPVEIRITQQDLANLVGASRQKTWQALKELEDSGMLKLMYRSIVVTAPHKLRNDIVEPRNEIDRRTRTCVATAAGASAGR